MTRETNTSPVAARDVAEHRIDLDPAYRVDCRGRWSGHGMAVMNYEGRGIGESKQPLYDAARYLLAHGLALPSDLIGTYREGALCLRSTVGRAAKLTIVEDSRTGPRIVAYRPFPKERTATKTPRAAE